VKTENWKIPLAKLSVDELVQLSQGLAHEIEKMRAQRKYLADKIAERLAAPQQAADGK
jgi:hypothetical protein